MVKLWISDKLELRWNEWPREINPNAPEWAQEEFEQLLAKAKKESVCIPRVEFVNAITDRIDIKTGEAIEYIESNYNPDTFVDLPISITIDRDQVKCCRLDCLASMQGGKCKAEIIVKVARLKPVEKPEPDSIFTREDVREMMERIKELENALADMITAPTIENEMPPGLQLVIHSILYDNTSSAQEKVISMKELLTKLTEKS